jgi:hypothetical protein
VVALLVAPPRGGLLAAVVLAVLGLGTVVSTVAAALPAHARLATGPDRGVGSLRALLRANLVRTAAWTAATGLAAVLVA